MDAVVVVVGGGDVVVAGGDDAVAVGDDVGHQLQLQQLVTQQWDH